jgi:hypothetical protein
MEIDALYCDVIVQRWEEFTGKKAERCPQGAANPTTQASPETEARVLAAATQHALSRHAGN